MGLILGMAILIFFVSLDGLSKFYWLASFSCLAFSRTTCACLYQHEGYKKCCIISVMLANHES